MPDEVKEAVTGKNCVFLMGPPRVAKSRTAGASLPVSERADAMELLSLLILAREFLSDAGVKEQGEVRREWLLQTLFPDLFTSQPQKARDRLVYLLNGELGLHAALGIRAHEGKREPNIVRLTFGHLWVDTLEIVRAARRMHLPASQDEVIALAERPLLDGLPYPWLHRAPFEQARATLDGHFLDALARKADGLIVRMEGAAGRGQSGEADRARTAALPLLDRAADRLQGYGDRLRQPEFAALRRLGAQLSDLRRRAAYGPPPGAAPPAVRTSRLPCPVTRFFGREREKAEVQALLEAGRLVTLVGMGGCGKTRLALEVAAALEAGGRGDVRLVELAGLGDPALLPQALAHALGVAEPKGVAITEALVVYLQRGRTLILLDNCEHLLAGCAHLVSTLLRACPVLSVLATSREPLNIAGEQLCRVPPLPYPAPDARLQDAPDPVAALTRYDAARLFLDRAFQFRLFPLGPESVAPVAAICATLEGVPLALELVATRVKALPLAQIAEMLSDRFGLLTDGRADSPARHKTLRAVVDWSYDLLTGPEQAVLCRLSVFVGGWTLDAAEAVAAPDGRNTLEALAGLVDKSLIIAELETTPGRYRMLETVRQYAHDCLRERGEWEDTRQRHKHYFLCLAEDAAPKMKGPDPKLWLDGLEMEIGNLRAALDWRTDEEALRLACALQRFWLMRDHLQEGRQWLERQTGGPVSAAVRARTLDAAGRLAFAQGEFQEALRLHQESHTLWAGLGDERGTAESLNGWGFATAHLGDYEAAKALLKESLRLSRLVEAWDGIVASLTSLAMIANYQLDYDTAKTFLTESLVLTRRFGDVSGTASSLHSMGIVAYYEMDYDTARSFFTEGLTLWRPIGDRYSIAKALSALGEVALYQGEYEAAGAQYQESLELRRQTGDKYGIANSINGLGEAAFYRHEYEAARELLDESLELRRQIGDKQSIPHSLYNLGQVARHQGNHALARDLFRESLALMGQNEDHYGIVASLDGLAPVIALLGQPERAVSLLGAAGALRQEIRSPRPSKAQEESQGQVVALTDTLGATGFSLNWAKGQAMTWEQAVTYALEETAF